METTTFRTFQKIAALAAACLIALLSLQSCKGGRTDAEKLGWKIAVQSYTFHTFTFVEALDKCNELGIKYMELYPGHRLGGKWGDTPFGPELDEATQKEVKEYAESKGVKIVASGVYTAETTEQWEKFFLMAHNMGMEYVTAEPSLEMWDLVEKLSTQYGIKVAVHNHPLPSQYWHPDNLLAAIGSRSASLGSCADVGHWNREGLDHLDCLRKLDGRVVSLHIKDIVAEKDETGWRHDCIWGTGSLDVPAFLQVLKDQSFKGYLAIEYEYNWDNSVPDIRQSLENFNEMVGDLK